MKSRSVLHGGVEEAVLRSKRRTISNQVHTAKLKSRLVGHVTPDLAPVPDRTGSAPVCNRVTLYSRFLRKFRTTQRRSGQRAERLDTFIHIYKYTFLTVAYHFSLLFIYFVLRGFHGRTFHLTRFSSDEPHLRANTYMFILFFIFRNTIP